MMVMYGGRAVERGPVDDLFYDPRHPYTLGLLHSTPHVDARARRLRPIQGVPPSLEHLPAGCAFHPRCAFRFDRCFAERPPLAGIRRRSRQGLLLWPGAGQVRGCSMSVEADDELLRVEGLGKTFSHLRRPVRTTR